MNAPARRGLRRLAGLLVLALFAALLTVQVAQAAGVLGTGAGSGTTQSRSSITAIIAHNRDQGGALYAQGSAAAPASSGTSTAAVWIAVAVAVGVLLLVA